MLKKLVSISAIIAVVAVTIMPLSSEALLFTKKCYGLKVCQTNPAQCKKDSKGSFYQRMPRGACNRALKNQK